MLQLVHPGLEIHEHLWVAVQTGLIFREESSYRFLHDRVQEAAYSLIPKNSGRRRMLRIGRLLAGNAANRDEAIFEIVSQAESRPRPRDRRQGARVAGGAGFDRSKAGEGFHGL